MTSARISEIFCSIQGEGLYAGQKQVFVRLAGCALRCSYCDERAASSAGRLETVGRIGTRIRSLARSGRAQAVSITGGEPLLQPSAVRAIAVLSRRLGLPVHLETGGSLYREMADLREEVDVIAADIKLPCAVGGEMWSEHRRFLSVAPGKTFVKVVVTSLTPLPEFRRAVTLAASVSSRIPFFIQPVTPVRGLRAPARSRLETFHRVAAGRLSDVRIMPQLHHLWGVK